MEESRNAAERRREREAGGVDRWAYPSVGTTFN